MPKILIADDDKNLRKFVATSLRIDINDLEVELAGNAAEEIEKARAGGYDLILTDLDMGPNYEDSGLYAIGKIREFDGTTPIILWSSQIKDPTRRQAMAIGATEVLNKRQTPPESLGEKVRGYLTKEGGVE